MPKFQIFNCPTRIFAAAQYPKHLDKLAFVCVRESNKGFKLLTL